MLRAPMRRSISSTRSTLPELDFPEQANRENTGLMEMTTLVLLTLLVLIALAAPRYGIDSRPTPTGEDPPPGGPTPWGDARALARWARHVPTHRAAG